MNFQEAENTYATLRQQLAARQIRPQDFSMYVSRLRLQDPQGAWWQICETDGSWLRWDGAAWRPAIPPHRVQAQAPVMAAQPMRPQPQAPVMPAQPVQPQPQAVVMQPRPAPQAMPAVRPQKVTQPPQTLLQLLVLILKGMLKGWLIKIPLSIGIMLFVWVFHTFLLIGPNGGFGSGTSKILDSILALNDRVVTGTLFWTLLSMTISSFIAAIIRNGPVKIVNNLTSAPGWIVKSVKRSRLAGPSLALGFGALTILFGVIQGNRINNFLLGVLFMGSVIAQQQSFPSLVARLGWSDLQRLLKPKRPLSFDMAWVAAGLTGATLGFFGASILPFAPYCGCASVVLLLGIMIALIFLQKGRPAMGAAILLLALILTAGLATSPALADDGGWEEAGGSFGAWVQSEGAAVAVAMGLPPSLGAALGTLIALGALGLPIPGGITLPEAPVVPGDAGTGPSLSQILNIIQNNPQLNGGPGDNTSTQFTGGKGPGRCSINGLPNYWVNTANLNLYLEDVVYRYSGLGPDIILRMSYNSAPGNAGMFGRNWRFSYESAIQHLPDRILVWKGSGQRLSYRMNPARSAQNPNGPLEAESIEGSRDRLFDYGAYFLLVEHETHLSYRYTKTQNTAWVRLTAILDENENAVQLNYNPDGTLQAVVDAAGRLTQFAYDLSRRCTGFALPDGRQAKYAYNQRGNLVQAVDLLGTVTNYEYDSDDSLTRIVIGRDQKATTFVYQNSGEGKYLAGVTDAAGNRTRYELVSVEPRQVRVTNPEGQATTYYSTPEGYTERLVDPLGSTVTTGFANRLPVSFTNANKQTARVEYDAFGNRVRMIDPMGAVWASTYDGFGRLTSETEPSGATWRYTYDGRGNLVRTVSPQGRTISLEYDAKGQVLTMSDGLNNRVRFTYDAFGNVTSRTEPTGSTARMQYDSAGMRMVAYTDARGNTTRYEYDANDRLTRAIYPDGTSKTFAFDCCAGTSVVDENGSQTNFRRDAMLMLNEQKDAAGGGYLVAYDRNYRPLKLVDALGHMSLFSYDAAGRQVQEVNPLGKTIQSRFDPNGNLVALVNEQGQTTRFEYDGAGRLVRTTDPLGQLQTIKRDTSGRPVEVAGGRGVNVGLVYGPDGDLVAKTYNGSKAAAYEFDAANNLARMQDSSGMYSFVNNPAGMLIAIHYPDGNQVSFVYDEVRSLSSVVYPGSFKVDYTYDRRDRVTKTAWQGGSITYQYDGVGNVTSETRSNGADSVYSYDARGRTVELSHARGSQPFARIRYVRNANGDIISETGVQPAAIERAEAGESVVFNALDQVERRGQDSYSYDADGNLIAISNGKWQAGYDPENRLAEVTREGQKTTYLYNGLGHRIQAATGATVRNYHYDLKGRLLFETGGNGEITRFYIYSGGLLAACYTPDGQSYFYHFNHQGSTLAMTNTAGEVVAAYRYTPFGKIAGQSEGLKDNPFTFIGAYGVMDEGGGLYYMKNRYYDAVTGRFVQKDPLGIAAGLNLYGYVANNPLNRIDPRGLIDRGFPNSMLTGKPPDPGADLTPLSGPAVATTNIAIGAYGVYSAVTGIMSGGSIPLATFLLAVAGSRIYSTVKRAINNEYGAEYKPSDIPKDLVDPTKGIRGGMSWTGQKWQEFNDWGARTMGQLENSIYQCYGVPNY